APSSVFSSWSWCCSSSSSTCCLHSREATALASTSTSAPSRIAGPTRFLRAGRSRLSLHSAERQEHTREEGEQDDHREVRIHWALPPTTFASWRGRGQRG